MHSHRANLAVSQLSSHMSEGALVADLEACVMAACGHDSLTVSHPSSVTTSSIADAASEPIAVA